MDNIAAYLAGQALEASKAREVYKGRALLHADNQALRLHNKRLAGLMEARILEDCADLMRRLEAA